MTFRQWLKQKNIPMKPWQLGAADAFLEKMRPHRAGGTGKSYLVRALHNYTDECGNRMLLEPEFAEDQKKRGRDHVRGKSDEQDS